MKDTRWSKRSASTSTPALQRGRDADADQEHAEGARITWSRAASCPGAFYALPQSPQQYKQLLMVAGFDRYLPGRPVLPGRGFASRTASRKFTQIDLEMSFVTPEESVPDHRRHAAALMKTAGHGDVKLPIRGCRMTTR